MQTQYKKMKVEGKNLIAIIDGKEELLSEDCILTVGKAGKIWWEIFSHNNLVKDIIAGILISIDPDNEFSIKFTGNNGIDYSGKVMYRDNHYVQGTGILFNNGIPYEI